MKEVKELFRPEFINRVDEMIVFHSLAEEDIQKITELMLKQVAERLAERDVKLSWNEEAVKKLAQEGYDPKFGARPLRRLIQRTVEDSMSEGLLSGTIRFGETVMLTVKDGQITVTGNETPEPEKEAAAVTKKKTTTRKKKATEPVPEKPAE